MACRNRRVPSWMELIPLVVTIGKSRSGGRGIKSSILGKETVALLRE